MSKHLFETPVNNIVTDQKLVVIDSKTHMTDALKILAQNNIYSAPVLDTAKNIYYGFLDWLDIVMFILSIMSNEDRKGRLPFSFEQHIQKYGSDLAKNVADISGVNPMIPIRASDPVSEALKVFAETGTHRVPILEGDSVAKIGHVLTQTAVISWLGKNVGSLGDIVNKSLDQLGVQKKPVISVDLESTCYDAFKKMADNRVTAVAVLNADGTLLSNLSAKDIKEIKLDELVPFLNRPVIELVQRVRSRQINVSYPSFHCHMHNKLIEVIQKLSVLRVHRLYIVDDAMRPIGVLSLGDLFKLLQS